MKKIIFMMWSAMALPSVAQIDETGWRLGLQLGISGNSADFSGGMENANGRFRQNDFAATNFGFAARYDFCRHLMIETGMGVSTFGFNYSIAENYSLVRDKNKVSSINTSFAALELPLDLYYKFNPNCRNVRWVLGAGIAPTFRAKQTIDADFSMTPEGRSSNYLVSTSDFYNTGFLLLRYSAGREKIFRNNSILRVSLLVTLGFSNIATSTVRYTLDNTQYSHTFKNNGSSVGFRVAYFLNTKPNSFKHTKG
jgi:hypothetical protein